MKPYPWSVNLPYEKKMRDYNNGMLWNRVSYITLYQDENILQIFFLCS